MSAALDSAPVHVTATPSLAAIDDQPVSPTSATTAACPPANPSRPACPPELHRIGLAQIAMAAAEMELRSALRAAHDAGFTWSDIGRALGPGTPREP